MTTYWKITHYEQGEDPIVDIMTRFADAWVLALPYPQVDRKNWHMENRATVEERFAAGETAVLVAWTECHTAHTEIQKVTETIYYH